MHLFWRASRSRKSTLMPRLSFWTSESTVTSTSWVHSQLCQTDDCLPGIDGLLIASSFVETWVIKLKFSNPNLCSRNDSWAITFRSGAIRFRSDSHSAECNELRNRRCNGTNITKIRDRTHFYREVHRVLKPGRSFLLWSRLCWGDNRCQDGFFQQIEIDGANGVDQDLPKPLIDVDRSLSRLLQAENWDPTREEDLVDAKESTTGKKLWSAVIADKILTPITGWPEGKQSDDHSQSCSHSSNQTQSKRGWAKDNPSKFSCFGVAIPQRSLRGV